MHRLCLLVISSRPVDAVRDAIPSFCCRMPLSPSNHVLTGQDRLPCAAKGLRSMNLHSYKQTRSEFYNFAPFTICSGWKLLRFLPSPGLAVDYPAPLFLNCLVFLPAGHYEQLRPVPYTSFLGLMHPVARGTILAISRHLLLIYERHMACFVPHNTGGSLPPREKQAMTARCGFTWLAFRAPSSNVDGRSVKKCFSG